MTDTDLLMIVPTKGRPHLIGRLLDATKATAAEPVDVVLVVCESELDRYRRVIGPEPLIQVVPDDTEYPAKLNLGAAEFAADYRYLALFNDDHVPESPGWDVALKGALATDAFGVAYGPDGVWANGEIPSAPVLTSSMYAALGWVALPRLHHILVDNVWKTLAELTGTLHFLPDVMIRHHHRDNGLAPSDDTYRLTGDNKEHEAEDSSRYWTWIGSPEYYENIAALEALNA